MDVNSSADRRRDRRHPLATGVEFFHPPTKRDFPGRCVDISRSGMLMYVPAKVPVVPGQSIRLTVGGAGRPEFAEITDKPINATIVRVDRHKLLSMGYLAVGVQFAEV